jgi:antitoxin component YwqK of YwqJK toxin-antitoxin module
MVVYFYKKCQPINDYSKRVIGIFELLEDTIILPKINNKYSKIRINKCKLIRVEDLDGNYINLDKIESVCFSLFDLKVIFEKDKISSINNFDETDILLGNGILGFFEKIRAQLYLLDKVENGLCIYWGDDGNKYSETFYKNNIKNGKEIFYYKNGNNKTYTEYYDGIKINMEYSYDINGKIINCINHNTYFEYNGKYT